MPLPSLGRRGPVREGWGTRSGGPLEPVDDKLFLKFFAARAGLRIFTADLSLGKYENFFAVHTRFRRATIC